MWVYLDRHLVECPIAEPLAGQRSKCDMSCTKYKQLPMINFVCYYY
ncbi:hypothetical protein KAM385_47020 [Aeromonas hydrophila]|nr:hypothetical protein KAM385_47020 [Aeromonas hydrophila]